MGRSPPFPLLRPGTEPAPRFSLPLCSAPSYPRSLLLSLGLRLTGQPSLPSWPRSDRVVRSQDPSLSQSSIFLWDCVVTEVSLTRLQYPGVKKINP